MTLLTEIQTINMITEIFPHADISSTYDFINVHTNEDFISSTLLNKIKGKYYISWKTDTLNNRTSLTIVFKINY